MPIDQITRRSFIHRSLSVGIAYSFNDSLAQEASPTGQILTVRGPIRADSLGMALPHEHVICDFIGADQTNPERWNQDEVVGRMLPYLKALKDTGVSTFFDCTPAFIGRDPVILKRLSQATNLNIVTNTGFYGGANDKYVPQEAYEMSTEAMANHWIEEFENGIDGTGIRPGFVKIGVDAIADNAATLSEIDAKIVRAAAQTSRKTGLSVTCHTGGGLAGLAALRLFIASGAKASSFIVAHADNHGESINKKVADMGAWVSLDAIGRRPLKQHLELIPKLLSHRADRLLLSQDNGWYSVGEPRGGEIRGYTDLTQNFLPALRAGGVSQTQIDQLMRLNPRNAFAI